MRNKLFVVGSLLILASMVLGACATATPAPSQPQVVEQTVIVPGEVQVTTVVETVQAVVTATPEPMAAETPVLRINLGTYPDIIDPQKSSFVNEIAHLAMIYEGLTKLDKDLNTIPGAAESWEYNEDATELTFKLRDGLTYSDGTPLNALRFQYSIMRNINPETAGEYAQITDEILGAPEWRTGTDADGNAVCQTDEEKAACEETVKSSIAALDSAGNACTDYEQADCTTLKLKLSRPAPYFHTVMSLWVTYPAKEENITTGGDNWWNSSLYQIGNGPFILDSLEPFVRGYFVPNTSYEGGAPSYDLEYSYITDTAVAFEAYKNNEFDIITLAAEDLATVQNDPALSPEAHIYPGSCTFALMYHQLKPPFNDQKVREAFSEALDRDAWVTDVLKGLGAPTLTWIPPGFPGYQDGETRWGFDATKAVQTLTDAGYTVENGILMGPDGQPIEIVDTFSDTPRNRTRNEWLASKWKEVLGLDVQLNPVESTTYTALTKDINTAPQMYILGWCADYPDPQNWLSVYWKTGAFGERIGYSNPDFDKLVDQADTTVDPATRADLYQQAQDLLVAGSPVSFMWNNVNSYLIKPWITGYELTPQDSPWPGYVNPASITVGPMP